MLLIVTLPSVLQALNEGREGEGQVGQSCYLDRSVIGIEPLGCVKKEYKYIG